MIVGIDLGTTNSVIAYIDELGLPQIIPNRDGERVTPSVVLFEDNRPIVGTIAKNDALSDPLNAVQFVKRQMGNRNYKFITEEGEDFAPEEISAIILRKLKQDAEAFLGRTIKNAVITVPAYYDDAQRKATKDAGQIAGFKVLKIINEPTAAALACGYGKKEARQNIIVYDMGGGTFDVTLMTMSQDEIIIRATGGDRSLGGFNIDNTIMEVVRERFIQEHKVDLYDDITAMQDLRYKAEISKNILATREKTLINIVSQGKQLQVQLTRKSFHEKIMPMLRRTITIMKSVVIDAEYTWDNIDKILLVGGSSRLKLVAEMIREETGKDPSYEVNPDEVVAIGAAIQALIIDKERVKGMGHSVKGKITDVNSHSLGIIAFDEDTKIKKNFIVLKRNTSLPARGSHIFYTVNENQEYITIQVTEGEDEEIEYVKVIGKVEVNIPKRPSGSPIEIVISYDENGLVHVSAIDEVTRDYLGEMDINRKSNLSLLDVVKKTKKISNLHIE